MPSNLSVTRLEEIELLAAQHPGVEAVRAARLVDRALGEARADQQVGGPMRRGDLAEGLGAAVEGVMDVEDRRAVAMIGPGDGAVMGHRDQARSQVHAA